MMLTRKPKPKLNLSTQSGFTLIESLLAIIIVSILMIGIAPVITLSVATRVQAKRVERATDAAKSYIDGVRSGAIDDPPITQTQPSAVSAPSATLPSTCNDQTYCSPDNLYCIDGDGNGNCTNNSFHDMLIQGMGYHPEAPANVAAFNALDNPAKTQQINQGYLLGIRVYRADAFANNRTLLPGTGDEGVAASFTGGTGLKPQVAPLLKLTTEVVTDETQFSELCERIAVAEAIADGETLADAQAAATPQCN